jgi:putative ABC transport system substrate-binding protein
MRDMLKETETAAGTLGVHLQLVEVRSPDEFDLAFSTVIRERSEALLVFPSTILFAEGKRIGDLAAKHRLPSMFDAREFVDPASHSVMERVLTT